MAGWANRNNFFMYRISANSVRYKVLCSVYALIKRDQTKALAKAVQVRISRISYWACWRDSAIWLLSTYRYVFCNLTSYCVYVINGVFCVDTDCYTCCFVQFIYACWMNSATIDAFILQCFYWGNDTLIHFGWYFI